MHIQLGEHDFQGTGKEILEQMRELQFDPNEFPDNETYLWQLQANYIKIAQKPCPIPDGNIEVQARAMFRHLEEFGTLIFKKEEEGGEKCSTLPTEATST